MTRAYFIAGTDTGVGKTLVACALLRAARAGGLTTAAIKPVAAGCDRTPFGWRNQDALRLQRAASLSLAYEQVNPVALPLAIAPHLAAAAAGWILTAADLAESCAQVLALGADFTLIEGAGGWRAPLGDRETLADIPRLLAVPVILVVAMRLGCLNHALLSAEAIRRDGLELAGWVANHTDAEVMSHYRENRETLEARLGCPLLGEIPYLDGGDSAAFARARQFVDLTRLL
jgi:dethiobiotin synthetase